MLYAEVQGSQYRLKVPNLSVLSLWPDQNVARALEITHPGDKKYISRILFKALVSDIPIILEW